MRFTATCISHSGFALETDQSLPIASTAPNAYEYGGGTGEPFLPHERIDLPTALAGFTINSAYVNHLDHLTGSIEVGKRADLAIVDRDVFAHSVEEIADASVVLTFVDGERVYDAERQA